MAFILQSDHEAILRDWLGQLESDSAVSRDPAAVDELRSQAETMVRLLRTATEQGDLESLSGKPWLPVLQFLEQLSQNRAVQGFTVEETARFVFSLKKPLFAAIRRKTRDAEALAEETWRASDLIDKLGMATANAFITGREQVIRRQQEELLELSTPVVKVWNGVLALPMIGTLDSARTQVVMESLLQRIVETGSEIAIIDITGVPTVDTLVAQHLLKTVTAIRLMGAECIISGVRPQIAQTIVHLGVDLEGVTTKANLSDALALALKRLGLTVSKAKP
ncbi:MAG: STAS domain-containing protein [Aureliella sp.]|jgi:rsbT co-antagonist protein RsbR